MKKRKEEVWRTLREDIRKELEGRHPNGRKENE